MESQSYSDQGHDNQIVGPDLATETDMCLECGCTDFITDWEVGETVCTKCGHVKDSEVVNRGPEWRAFKQEEYDERSRRGPAESQLSLDKGTTFDVPNKGITLEQKIELDRMKKANKRSKLSDSKDRNLSEAIPELKRLADNLYLPPNILEQAGLIYRKFLKKDLVKGRSIDASVAASLYAVCRENNIPRTLKEFAKYSTRDYKEIARTYRFLIRELEMDMPVPEAEYHISKIASRLDNKFDKKVSMRAQNLSAEILRLAKQYDTTAGKDPKSLAATALYLACTETDEKITQKEISYAAGTTEVTIRNRMREFEEKKLPIEEIAKSYLI